MNEYLDLILDFAKEAGEMALKGQKHLQAQEKTDCSLVTQIDISISDLFKEKISKYLETGNHKILDEEKLPSRSEFFNDKTEYLWTLDPIDGTTTYYYGFPLWGIGISLYKNFKPFIGAIYLPSIKEIIYTDGKDSYHAEDAFGNNERITIIKPTVNPLIKKSVVLAHKLKNHDRLRYTMLDLYSAYVCAFYAITGRAMGSFFNKPQKLWDITASLPIALNAGLIFRNTDKDEDLKTLNENMVDEKWYLNDTYLLTTEKLYSDIKDILE